MCLTTCHDVDRAPLRAHSLTLLPCAPLELTRFTGPCRLCLPRLVSAAGGRGAGGRRRHRRCHRGRGRRRPHGQRTPMSMRPDGSSTEVRGAGRLACTLCLLTSEHMSRARWLVVVSRGTGVSHRHGGTRPSRGDSKRVRRRVHVVCARLVQHERADNVCAREGGCVPLASLHARINARMDASRMRARVYARSCGVPLGLGRMSVVCMLYCGSPRCHTPFYRYNFALAIPRLLPQSSRALS